MTSLKLREYSHVLFTWDVYPRVKYFIYHFKDLLLKVKRIVETVPSKELLPSDNIVKELEKFANLLDKPLKVVVLGHKDLKPESFVFDKTPLIEAQRKEQKIDTDGSDTGIKVTICNLAVGALEERDAENIVEQISEAAEHTEMSSLFIVVQCPQKQYSAEQLQDFRKEVRTRLHKAIVKTPAEGNILFGLNEKELSKRVSAVLETRCVYNFLRMKNFLSSFGRAGRTPQEKQYDVLETQEFLNTVQGFLRNGLGFVDMLQDSGDTPFVDLILNKLAVVVRCSVVDQVASKYALSQDLCNKSAHKMDFEKEMKSNITKNTRYHLGKLEEPCRECLKATKAKDSYYQFPGYKFTFIAYSIREDIKPALAAMEKTLDAHCQYLQKVGRLVFEIDGCVSQSLADIDSSEKRKPYPAVSAKMRQNIFALENVFGMGFIYGVFEIHLQKNATKHELEPRIRNIMKKENFCYPYNLRYVIKAPEYLYIRPGDEIKVNVPQRQSGTLGCFLKPKHDSCKSTEKKVYAITCAHVVRTGDMNEQDVHHNNTGLFARTCPNLMIPSTEDENAPVDMAALDVIKDKRAFCKNKLRYENGREGNANLYREEQSLLQGRAVSKYGAKSGITTGTIISAEYYTSATEDSFVLIGRIDRKQEEEVVRDFKSLFTGQHEGAGGEVSQGEGDDRPYAEHGDSGAVNCVQNIDDDCTDFPVKAVSLIHKGQFLVEDHPGPLCLSFMLHAGICHLNERCGTNLEWF